MVAWATRKTDNHAKQNPILLARANRSSSASTTARHMPQLTKWQTVCGYCREYAIRRCSARGNHWRSAHACAGSGSEAASKQRVGTVSNSVSLSARWISRNGPKSCHGFRLGTEFHGNHPVDRFLQFYHQLVFGEGIGSYHGLPDATPETASTDTILGFHGWMVGITQAWTYRLSSNFTYAKNSLDNSPLQQTDDVHGTTYLAANLIWEPVDRIEQLLWI